MAPLIGFCARRDRQSAGAFATAERRIRRCAWRLADAGQEKLGIVGESGSGKSLTARSILRLLPGSARITADKLSFDGIDILTADEAKLRAIRGKRAGLILQDPKFSLNPVMTAGAQIAEAWRAHRGGTRKMANQAAIDLLAQVQIREPARVAKAYPHELRAAWASAR